MSSDRVKAIKVHGQFVKCKVCKRHNAVERFGGIPVCRKCLRPMILGIFIGRSQVIKTEDDE